MKHKLLPILLVTVLLATGCGQGGTEPLRRSGFYFDTVIQISLYDSREEALLDHCFALAETYEGLFSPTLPGSDVSRINDQAGMAVAVDPETLALLNEGKKYNKETDGRFALTVGALSALWDLSGGGSEDFSLPDPEEIRSARATIDDEGIVLSAGTAGLTDSAARLDPGGIAKGYIADRMKEYLNENGAVRGIINLGGNTLCLGPKEDGSPYAIGIQEPFGGAGDLSCVLHVPEGSVVTSGIYERYVEIDGQIYHHVLDTRTGYPADSGLASATIWTSSSARADALSTAVLCMGLDEGRAFVEGLPGVEAVFVTTEGEVEATSGITEGMLTLPDGSPPGSGG